MYDNLIHCISGHVLPAVLRMLNFLLEPAILELLVMTTSVSSLNFGWQLFRLTGCCFSHISLRVKRDILAVFFGNGIHGLV